MNIRAKLTLRFTLIVSALSIFVSFAVYWFSSIHREREFDIRLRNEGISAAKLLLDVADVDSSLLNIIRNLDASDLQQYITIHSENGQLLFTNAADKALNIHKVHLQYIESKPSNYTWQARIGDRDLIGFHYINKDKTYSVIVSAIDRWGLEQLHFLRLILVGCCIGVVLVAALAGYFYSKKMLSPIDQMIREANAISTGQFNKRLSTGRERDELERLAVTFNLLLQRAQRAFEAQRHFVANASHELRSPLTALIGHIEVMLRKKRTVEEHEELLVSLSEDIKRLNDLSNGLLALAKTDALEKIQTTTFRFDELLDSVITEVLYRHENYQIELNYDELPDDDKLQFEGNDNLLRVALVNLIDNACKYSSNHSAELKIRYSTNTIMIQCIDHGIGIPPEELERVFDRFFRASNARGIYGHGIGLALSRRIAELHGGTLTVISELDKGTTVTLTLPLVYRNSKRTA